MDYTHKPQRKRVGIFRGTFDPLHEGHVGFAALALKMASLDYIYFLPENSPKHKTPVKDFVTRVTTIRKSLESYDQFRLLEISTMSGSIKMILPALAKLFKNDRLVFLMGSDVAKTIGQWADRDSLCRNNELVIGLRSGDSRSEIDKMLASLEVKPNHTAIFVSPAPGLSSSDLRKIV